GACARPARRLGAMRPRQGESAIRGEDGVSRSHRCPRNFASGRRASAGRCAQNKLHVGLAYQDGRGARAHGRTEAPMTTHRSSVDVRASIVDTFRRDLVGPGPQDLDLANERLNENPSRWYLAGFLAPADDPLTQDGPQEGEDDPSAQEEMETDVEEPVDDGAGGAAGDAEVPD